MSAGLREWARGDGGERTQHAQPVGVTELVDGLARVRVTVTVRVRVAIAKHPLAVPRMRLEPALADRLELQLPEPILEEVAVR